MVLEVYVPNTTRKPSKGAFDKRIVRVGLEIDGDFLQFEDLDIRIQGQKFGSPIANQCTIRISNLTRNQRNYILTRASPILLRKQQRNPVFVTVDVGRESYGTFRLFEGTVYTSTVTPPPDIGIVLRSLTQSEASGLIQSNSQGAVTQLRDIAQSIADQSGLILEFKATPKQIANYSFSGAISKQIEKLQQVGDIRAFVDNKTLVVMDKGTYRGTEKFLISKETGMVGVPQASESGVIVQTLINPSYQIGSGVEIQSMVNPSVNGSDYNIAQMHFDIANRDTPFFYTLVLSNFFLNQGTV